MRALFRLNPSQTSQTINLESFYAASMFVENWTASAVLVRVGGSDVPNLSSADHRVPAMGSLLIPVEGRVFAAGFSDPAAIQNPTSSNLFSTATIVLLSADEIPPNTGTASYLSLSIAELSSGLQSYSGPTTIGPYDIGAWAGAVVLLAPGSGSGQTLVTVQTSADLTTWTTTYTGSAWPSIPATILIPRIGRYFRIVLAATAISGEPAIAGAYLARATLTEILETAYSPSSASIVRAYSLPALGSTSIYLLTAGIQSLSLGLNNATGTEGEIVVYAGPTATGPWRLVQYREQNLQGFYNSIYRSIGNLDLYTRVDILELDNTPMTGTIAFSIPVETDLTSVLQSIYAALGDIGQPTNVNQSIYHELDTIRQTLNSIYFYVFNSYPLLQNIEADVDSILTLCVNIDTTLLAISGQLATISGQLSTVTTQLTSINTTLSTISGQLTTINTTLLTTNSLIGTTNSTLSTISATLTSMLTQLTNINTNLTTINASIGTSNAHLSNISVNSNTMVATLGSGGSILSIQGTIVTGGVAQLLGTIPPPNRYLVSASIEYRVSLAAAGVTTCVLSLGNALAPAIPIVSSQAGPIPATSLADPTARSARVTHHGRRTNGILMQSPTSNSIWITHTTTGMGYSANVVFEV